PVSLACFFCCVLFFSAGLLLLLLSGLHADSEVKVVNAMVGSDVELSCVFPHRSHFDLNELYVYWQISGSDTVVTYYLSDNKSEGHEDPRYKDRAHLLLDRMKQGDFSLHLQNVTPQDAQQFKCLVIKEPWKPGKLLEKVVRLNVAANFSVPVVSTSSNTSRDQELTFTCMSTDGYPRPNVYWINRTDNSLLHEALQNNTVFLNQRGLYDVVSILTIPWTPHVDVGCCIENVLLHQNLTSSSQAESFTGNKGRFTKSPDSPREEENAALYSLPSLLSAAVIVAVAVAWGCRSRRRGPQCLALDHTDAGDPGEGCKGELIAGARP
uniref:ICOS ligand n=1 Tax=Jaculus jaculus TaxID=51337 RepID=A0A8C5KMD4_JACJA